MRLLLWSDHSWRVSFRSARSWISTLRQRDDAFAELAFSAEELNDLRDWRYTMHVILLHVDQDIAQGAWRATAQHLSRGRRWEKTATALKIQDIDEAKVIVLRTIARIYAELEARNLDEEEVAKAA